MSVFLWARSLLTHCWMNWVKTGGPVKKHEISEGEGLLHLAILSRVHLAGNKTKQKRREREIEREGYWRAHDTAILDFVLQSDRTRYITTQQNVFYSAVRVWSKAWCRSTHVVWYHRDHDYWSTNHSGKQSSYWSQNQTGLRGVTWSAYMDRRWPWERTLKSARNN